MTNWPIGDNGASSGSGAASIPNVYRSTMLASEDFTSLTGDNAGGDHLIAILTPIGLARNFNPNGTFLDGYTVYLINLGAFNVIFDSAGIALTIPVGMQGKAIIDNIAATWR